MSSSQPDPEDFADFDIERGPRYTRHALLRAKQRFSDLRAYNEDRILRVLDAALLGGAIVEDPLPGTYHVRNRAYAWCPEERTVTVRGHIKGKAADFIIDRDSGVVITITDPYYVEPK